MKFADLVDMIVLFLTGGRPDVVAVIYGDQYATPEDTLEVKSEYHSG